MYQFYISDIFALSALVLYCGVNLKAAWLMLTGRPSNILCIRKYDEREAAKKLNAENVPAGQTVDKP